MTNVNIGRRTRTLILGTIAAMMMTSTAMAERKKVTTVEGITEYRLDNGLQVLLFPDRSKETVTVNVTYLVGSRHEGRGETGMAHLLEHMVFKGTPDHPDIWKALEDHGARFNGTTWVDRTNYFETLPTTVEGNLEWALTMEADRMINSHVRREDLDSEFSVVRNEFEIGENNPVRVLMERMVSAAYLWHNYGKSTIGSKSDIERVTIPKLRAFYKKYYQPDNAVLVIAGKFEPDDALKLVEKTFGRIPRPQRKLDETYTLEPVQDGARHVELRRNGDVAACGTVYHICASSHPDFAALRVVQQVLTDQPSGRLYKALVESGMAASVFGFSYPTKEPGVILNLAEVRVQNPVEPVLEKMQSVIEGLAQNEITDEEVKRAKRKLLKGIEMSLKSSGRVGVALSEYIAIGDWRMFFLQRDRIEKLTTDHVRRVAAHYFKESNRTSGIFYPTKEIDRTEVPSTPDVLALVKDYKGKEELSEGEEFEATPDNIERRVTRTTLSNGLKLALLPKETRGDGVNAVLRLNFGTEDAIRGRQTAVSLIPRMLMRGSKNHTYQQLRDKLDELKATVRMRSGGGMAGREDGSMIVTIRTDRQNLPKVIELVGEILTEPTFPTNEFEIVKKENLARLEEQLSDPRALGFNHIMRALNPWPTDDVRYVPTLEESVERLRNVDVDDLREIHKELFGAGHAEMTVVGDFDAGEIKKAIEKAVGKWKSPKPFKRIVAKYRGDVKGAEEVINTPDKKMAMVACGMNLELRDDDPDYPALHLANYVLGASAKSRLLNRLRQKEGLSYGTFSFLMAKSEDRLAVFAGAAFCSAQNTNKAYDSLLDEFEILIREGIGAEELADAKGSFAKKIKTQLANDSTVAGMLNNGLHLGRTMAFHKNLYDRIDRLTPPQVHNALKKHLSVARMVKVKAGDLKKADAVD